MSAQVGDVTYVRGVEFGSFCLVSVFFYCLHTFTQTCRRMRLANRRILSWREFSALSSISFLVARTESHTFRENSISCRE